ncbi:MAG: outer membrane lipoprotein-sorting protein [Candidatus Aminicenantaceae bacterium]
MKKKSSFIFILIFCLTSTSWMFSESKILKKVDEKTIGSQAPKDMEATITMKIVSSSGNEKIRKIKAWSKNLEEKNDLRVMKFLSPPDVRNIGFLVLDENQMYLYLPEFRRIRRIASHSKKESFMGSDFSYYDMGTSGFSEFYNSSLLKEDDMNWVLKLKKKPGKDKPYKSLKMWVSKESGLPWKTEMYDDSGKLWKETIQEVKQKGDYWIPVQITMKDKKNGSYTVMTMEDISVDQNLDDSIFTTRFLKRRVR